MDRRFLIFVLAAAALMFSAVWFLTAPAGSEAAPIADAAAPADTAAETPTNAPAEQQSTPAPAPAPSEPPAYVTGPMADPPQSASATNVPR